MNKFKHNDKVTCEILGERIEDARISINDNGRPYICQDKQNGAHADDKLGYKYSWGLISDFTDSSVKNLKLKEDYSQGDILVNKDGDKRKILGVCGEVYLMSLTNNFENYTSGYTKYELDSLGYSLFTEIKEYSMDEIAKSLGVYVKDLKIKKD